MPVERTKRSLPSSLAVALCFSASTALAGRGAHEPLRAQWYFAALDEPAPPVATHFLVSNEARHDRFAPALAGRGGAYLGVGGDANYTLIAVSGAERAYLLDHDAKVLALHRELGRRILAAATPAAFLSGLRDEADRPSVALADAWPAVVRHLERTAERRVRGLPTTWLGDPAMYAVIRDRWRRGAVELVLGDLAGEVALPSIAAAAASRGLRFAAVYLSNAEETLSARGRLLDNLRGLPRDERGVLLRTSSDEREPAIDGLWSYRVQPLGDLDHESSAVRVVPPQAALQSAARSQSARRSSRARSRSATARSGSGPTR